MPPQDPQILELQTLIDSLQPSDFPTMRRIQEILKDTPKTLNLQTQVFLACTTLLSKPATQQSQLFHGYILHTRAQISLSRGSTSAKVLAGILLDLKKAARLYGVVKEDLEGRPEIEEEVLEDGRQRFMRDLTGKIAQLEELVADLEEKVNKAIA